MCLMEAAGYARFEIGRPFGFLLGNEVFLFARMKRLIVQSDISIRGGSCVEQHRTAALQHCSGLINCEGALSGSRDCCFDEWI